MPPVGRYFRAWATGMFITPIGPRTRHARPAHPRTQTVSQASDGAEAVQMAGEVLPDVVLMDIRMPKITGIQAARQIKEVAPSAKVVMLTISDEEEDHFAAIRAGASGYLLKDIPLDEVAGAVRALSK